VDSDADELRELARKVRYGGNPEHKRNPGEPNRAPTKRCATTQVYIIGGQRRVC
jgi:hypothetical protein